MPNATTKISPMKRPRQRPGLPIRTRAALVLLSLFAAIGSLTGCLMVGGSSRGGFFIFPGGLGLVVLIVIVALLLRRR